VVLSVSCGFVGIVVGVLLCQMFKWNVVQLCDLIPEMKSNVQVKCVIFLIPAEMNCWNEINCSNEMKWNVLSLLKWTEL
jgi:hypothetical protein